MHRFSRRITAVKRNCRKTCKMITSVVSMTVDGPHQKLECWHSGNISTIAVIHDVYFQQAFLWV
jgi:hypothetical protein